MILVDSSVWINHLRRGDEQLAQLLEADLVLVHPFVVGELACGNLENRVAILAFLGNLPQARVATDTEALVFIDRHKLPGRGIGYIDAHLLASSHLSAPATLWTRDKRLAGLADELSVNYRS
jgi:predicted nucleic acid-binding protein